MYITCDFSELIISFERPSILPQDEEKSIRHCFYSQDSSAFTILIYKIINSLKIPVGNRYYSG